MVQWVFLLIPGIGDHMLIVYTTQYVYYRPRCGLKYKIQWRLSIFCRTVRQLFLDSWSAESDNLVVTHDIALCIKYISMSQVPGTIQRRHKTIRVIHFLIVGWRIPREFDQKPMSIVGSFIAATFSFVFALWKSYGCSWLYVAIQFVFRKFVLSKVTGIMRQRSKASIEIIEPWVGIF